MKKNNLIELWVLKFCLKVVYPKFNVYTFLVYLAIKYRYLHGKNLLMGKIMDTFKLESHPETTIHSIIKSNISKNMLSVIDHKCLIISKRHFIQLSTENFFYYDSGILWMSLKLTPESKKKFQSYKKRNEDQVKDKLNMNLSLLTSEIYKKLWPNQNTDDLNNARIVPIIGSNLVPESIAYVTEIEYCNITSSLGIMNAENIDITFHPLLSYEIAPKIATIAEVNLILNESDIANELLKEVLNNHFMLPKLVSVNDIFSVELCSSTTNQFYSKYIELIESTGKLYFKCDKLSDGNNTKRQVMYIVKGVTQLTIGENCHAIKPKNTFYKSQNNVDDCIHTCPSGLRVIFEQIQETIHPFLTGEIDEISSALPNPIIPIVLLTGATGSGRNMLVKVTAKYNGLNCIHFDCNTIQSSTAKQTESKINSMMHQVKSAAPTIVLMDNFEVFAVDSDNNEDQRIMEYFMNMITELYQNYTKYPIVFVAVAEKVDLKPNITRIFLDKIHIPKLNVQQRYEVLQWFSSVMGLQGYKDTRNNEILHRVASKTETFLYGDLDTLMHFAMRESYVKQINNFFHIPQDPDLSVLDEEDFNDALESIRHLQSQHLDAPKIPKVYWEDIGGLDKLKKELLKTIEFPIKFPHLFKNSSLKRSGILLYGPPGCGKTLVAKAVSTELNVSFMSVKGPELLNMYIGQSEENVRKVFQSARASSPCIVFLDELDALAPQRGSAGDSGGASDRVVSQLLAELDGVATADDASASSFVFIMGATNRPDLLEQSLLRPGRLDKLIYVGPYSGVQEKTSVLKALCRSYNLRPEVNLEDVAAALPERCTGADLMQVVSTARSTAVRALVDKLHKGVVKESDLTADSVIIGVSELCKGVESFRCSVTDEEISYYESLQTQM